jgi:hypothetical protein
VVAETFELADEAAGVAVAPFAFPAVEVVVAELW